MGVLDNDRAEVKRLFDKACGMKLSAYSTERAYGFPPDEAGEIELFFVDEEVDETLTIRLSPTGYEADGIAVRES